MSGDNFSAVSSNFSRTLSQTIYLYLKDAIVANKLQANQRIQEKDIASEFGVSTTPVREAVLRLAAEGYLYIDSHRKTVVKEISFEELKNILQTIAEIDAISVEHVVDHIQPEHLKKLRELTKKMDEAKKKNEIENFLEINTSFHKKIWDVLPNKIMQKTIEFVHGQLMRYTQARIEAFKEPGVMDKSVQEHRSILRALKNKNGKALKSLIKSNWKLLIAELP